MRKGVLLLCLAMTAGSLSACSTMDDVALTSSEPNAGGGSGGGGGSTGGTGGDDPDPGGTPGDPKPTPLGSGNKTYVFNSNGFSFAGLSEVDFINPDLDTDGRASVRVDPKDDDLGWPEAITMGWYDPALTPDAGREEHKLKGEYAEYRKISTNTDAELQYWRFDNSYAGQYRVLKGGNASATKNMAWFFGGEATDNAVMATKTGTASYEGNFAANATAGNWVKKETTDYDPNLEWRTNGTANIEVNFDTAAVETVMVPKYWEAYDLDGTLVIVDSTRHADPDQRYEFHDMTITGHATINRDATTGNLLNTFTGETDVVGGFVDGDNPLDGGFFGSDAQEVTGIFATRATLPAPRGGDVPINDDRRPFIQIQGAFHGTQTPPAP